ncbi:MAG: hypothetical protein ACRDKW_16335, partial [Actinomycetota bacterium]
MEVPPDGPERRLALAGRHRRGEVELDLHAEGPAAVAGSEAPGGVVDHQRDHRLTALPPPAGRLVGRLER